MKPGAVTVDFDPGESGNWSDYEEISYPNQEQGLPTHFSGMSIEDTARRRTKATAKEEHDEKRPLIENEGDDEGKDVYSKMKLPPGVMLNRNRKTSTGRVRPIHQAPPTGLREFFIQNLDQIPPVIYTLLSCWTRFHKIGHSPHVVWDEAHFGKFGSHYLKREFYFDVHPPLGKILVGFAGLLAGYDGSFDFKSGAEYPPEVPYVAMRVMLATFGVGMVPLSWYTAVELGMSAWACHLVTLMVLFDLGWLVISRFILLDSMLLFFTLLTVFCLTKFHNQQPYPFSFDWYMWLSFTGISIGLVTSVKMIGLFVTALVGLYTIEDLWEKFGDLKMSYRDQAKHWGARIVCLILVPFLVFMASFKLHFLILNHSGPGDAQMSSLFQANLVGNDFSQNPLEVTFGSKLTLKAMGFGGGLLHSHVQTYPTGSSQQQVTCYHYKDNNNEWLIMPTWEDPSPLNPHSVHHRESEHELSNPLADPNVPLRYLKHGDTIRLQHGPTTRNLHSHPIAAPVTKEYWEVSGYGNATVGDSQDYWIVEVVDDVVRGDIKNKKPAGRQEDKDPNDVPKEHRIHSLTTRLRFRHQNLGCYLRAANAVLPQWGFKQIEVTCIPGDQTHRGDVRTYWNVESHWNDRLPPSEIKHRKSPFLRDFWHLNVAMMTSNNALIPDPDKEDILASKPFDWPFMHLGLRMCGWGDNQTKYYLLGNPIVWWGGTTSLILIVLVGGVYILRRQRQYRDFREERDWDQFWYVAKIAGYGWGFHFIPFLIMGRVTYVHHYLPTLYFSVLMFAHVLDHFIFSSMRLPLRIKAGAFAAVAGLIVGVFWWFRGFAWGIDGPINEYWGVGWRKSWNVYN